MHRGEHGVHAVARSGNANTAARIDKCGEDEAQQLIAAVRCNNLVGQKFVTTGRGAAELFSQWVGIALKHSGRNVRELRHHPRTRRERILVGVQLDRTNPGLSSRDVTSHSPNVCALIHYGCTRIGE